LISLEITAQNDSVSIHKSQVKNVYIGLKKSELYKEYYTECLQVSNDLNQIINEQDHNLKKSLEQISILNSDTEVLNQKIIDSEKQISRLENKKIPLYKHPILYVLLGFAGGIYLMK